MASQGSRKLKQAIQQYTPVQVWDWLFKSCEVNGIILLHEGLIDAKDIVSYIAGGKCKKPEDWDEIGFPPVTMSNEPIQLQAIIRRLQGIVSSLSRIPTFRRRFKNLVKLLYMEAIEIGATKSGHGNGSRCSNGIDDSKDGMQVLRMSLAFRFVESKFEEIFKKHAKSNPNGLTSMELDEMLQANRKPNDYGGWIGALSEWKILYLIGKDKNGILPKETIRGVYDGSLFESMAKKHASKKQGKWPSLLLPIEVKNIKLAKHTSDSGVYDSEGRFVEPKFEEIFKKHAKSNANGLTSEELDEMLKANREPKDYKGWVGALSEWKILYLLGKDKNGILSKETIRGVYDGSLFEIMAKEHASKKQV
nr:probable peroxygenase 5 isoform X1 [Ipomoea batatas]